MGIFTPFYALFRSGDESQAYKNSRQKCTQFTKVKKMT